MPFVSKAQQGFLHAHPEKLGAAGLKEWDAATKGKHLPERAHTMKKDYASHGLEHDEPKHEKHQAPVRAKHGIKHIHITNTDDGGHHIVHTKDDGTEIHHVAPDVAGLQQNLGQMLGGAGAEPAEPAEGAAPAAMPAGA